MKTITFRPTPDALEALAVRMHETGANRSQAINAALISAVVDPGPSEQAVARLTVPGDKSEGRKTTPPPAKDTRSQQERMDDFYRANMVKGKK